MERSSYSPKKVQDKQLLILSFQIKMACNCKETPSDITSAWNPSADDRLLLLLAWDRILPRYQAFMTEDEISKLNQILKKRL